jgi:hypothetical protein
LSGCGDACRDDGDDNDDGVDGNRVPARNRSAIAGASVELERVIAVLYPALGHGRSRRHGWMQRRR